MKAELIGNTRHRGFMTVEILIAFSLVILSLGAVIIVSFGNQSLSVDSEINLEAITRVKTELETARNNSRYDFNLVNPSTATEESGPVQFTKILDVRQTGLFIKEISSTISWRVGGRTLSTMLTTLLVNIDAAKGGDTCSSVLSGDWKKPEVESVIPFSAVTPAGTYTVTDVDAYNKILYVTVGKTTNLTDPTPFIFDIHETGSPKLIGKIDNDPDSAVGMNGIATDGRYAYAANMSRPVLTGQLQIFGVSNSTAPVLLKNFPLPGNSAVGSSIFFKNEYIYLGTRSSAGPEFNIVSIENPSSPLRHGVFAVGNDINSIAVSGRYAYIASPHVQELKTLDISDPVNPALVASFNSGSGAGNGKNIYAVGNKVYLGKTTGAGFDFHILDNSDPEHIVELGGRDMASSVNGVIVRDYLTFLLTGTPSSGTKLQILKTSEPANIALWSTALPLSAGSNTTEPSMDCEGNRLYVSTNDPAGQGAIFIIKPGP